MKVPEIRKAKLYYTVDVTKIEFKFQINNKTISTILKRKIQAKLYYNQII